MNSIVLLGVVCLALLQFGSCSNAKKPHQHQGVIQPYTGEHLAYELSKEELETLAKGDYVTKLERSGKSGKGVIIQDIDAPPHVCMDRVRDLANYNPMVPNLKSILDIVNDAQADGSVDTTCKFNVGVSLVGFSYFLKLRYNAKYNTYIWALDYSKSSDFDDNIGHWQCLPHPQKGKEFTRVLYSSEVKLFSWIPEFVVNFLTKTALITSTTWVKKYSEMYVAKGADLKGKPTASAPFDYPNLSQCFVKTAEGGEKYVPDCMQNAPSGKENSENNANAGAARAADKEGAEL